MSEDANKLLKQRQLISDEESIDKWEVKTSAVSGKGVFATKNINANETIFKEKPLAIGPRTAPLPAVCVSCRRPGLLLEGCPGGCRLPICSQACASSPIHQEECDFLLAHLSATGEREVWCPFLYRALAPLRCLLLSPVDKAILRSLAQNKDNKHVEMLLLRRSLERRLEEEETELLELSCRVLNGVAFEVCLGKEELGISWRGLYPLAGIMNHSCSPNTRHHFQESEDGSPTMEVVATLDIPKGVELTTSYCPLLWTTMARRHFLSLTKEFLCACPRCSDPTEFGTYFSGVECSCGGLTVARRPLDERSPWECRSCGRTASAKEVLALQAESLRSGSPNRRSVYHAVKERLASIWSLGHKGKPYSEVTDEDIRKKLKDISDVIELNDRLLLGESCLKLSLTKELRATSEELQRRAADKAKSDCTVDQHLGINGNKTEPNYLHVT